MKVHIYPKAITHTTRPKVITVSVHSSTRVMQIIEGQAFILIRLAFVSVYVCKITRPQTEKCNQAVKARGVVFCSQHTRQISHLLLYPSLWLLVPGWSSQFLPLFPLQPGFEVIPGL